MSNMVCRWRNNGLAPRFRSAHTPEGSDTLFSSCPHCRLEALKEIPETETSSETEAALLLCQLDRIADLYSPPPLPVAESDAVNLVEVVASGFEDVGGCECKLMVRGQPCGTNSRGFNLVVLNDLLVPTEQRNFDTHEKEDMSERMADFIEGLPEGRLVLVATMDTAKEKLTARASAALRGLGADKIDKLVHRGSFAMVGMKGATPGSVPQAMCDKGKGPVTVQQYLPAPKVPLAVEVIDGGS